jgi:hypothetical protein
VASREQLESHRREGFVPMYIRLKESADVIAPITSFLRSLEPEQYDVLLWRLAKRRELH